MQVYLAPPERQHLGRDATARDVGELDERPQRDPQVRDRRGQLRGLEEPGPRVVLLPPPGPVTSYADACCHTRCGSPASIRMRRMDQPSLCAYSAGRSDSTETNGVLRVTRSGGTRCWQAEVRGRSSERRRFRRVPRVYNFPSEASMGAVPVELDEDLIALLEEHSDLSNKPPAS